MIGCIWSHSQSTSGCGDSQPQTVFVHVICNFMQFHVCFRAFCHLELGSYQWWQNRKYRKNRAYNRTQKSRCIPIFLISRTEILYQTVNDGVAHSKNPKKCAYHVTFDLDLENTLDAGLPGDHRAHVWSRSSHLPARRSDLRKSLHTDRQTDGQTTDASPLY